MAEDGIMQWRKHLRIDVPVLLLMTILFVVVFKVNDELQDSAVLRIIAMTGMIYFFAKFIWSGSVMLGALLTANYKLALRLLLYACIMVVFMFVSIRFIITMLKLV